MPLNSNPIFSSKLVIRVDNGCHRKHFKIFSFNYSRFVQILWLVMFENGERGFHFDLCSTIGRKMGVFSPHFKDVWVYIVDA